MQTLSKVTREVLADYIHRAMTFNRTHNDLDAKRACLAIVLLADDFGIRLPSLKAARELLKTFN